MQYFYSKKQHLTLISKLLLFFLLTFSLYGFSFSDPKKLHQEIKAEIKKELEKIIEKTPSAKLRNTWRKKRDEANAILENALLLSAPKFCPSLWDESVGLFEKAKKYASKRAYRKAIYLAKLAKENAQKSVECAQNFLDENTKKLIKKYKKLRSQMDEIRALVPPGAEELIIRANVLSLEVEDLNLAIELRNFKEAEKIAKTIEKKLPKLMADVDSYRKEHVNEEETFEENFDEEDNSSSSH